MPIVIIAVIVLAFPFFISFYISIQKEEKTLRFAITVFGITVFRLNAAIFGYEIHVNRTFKKPYKLKFAPDFSQKMIKFPKIKISILSVRLLTRAGFNDNFFVPLYITAFNTIENAFFRALQTVKPHVKVTNELSFYQNNNMFDVFLRIKAVINLIDIIFMLVSILSEKVQYAIGK